MSSGRAFLHGVGLAVMAGGAVGGFAAPLALVAYGLEAGTFIALFAPSVAAILAGAGLATWANPRPAPHAGSPAYGYVRSYAGEGSSLSMTASDVTTVAALSSVSISLSDGGSCGSDACGC